MSVPTEELHLTPTAMKAMVTDKMASRKFWILLPGIAGFQVINQIERKFYTGGAEDDFKQIVFPFTKMGFYGLVFAIKRRLSAPTLAGFIRSQLKGPQFDRAPVTAFELMQDDLVCLGDAQEVVMLTENFRKWLAQT